MINVGRKYEEKRDFPRMNIEADLTYSRSQDKGLYEALSKNLSHSGILFETEQTLSPGESVVLTMDSRNNKFIPLKAKAEVIRVNPISNKFLVACRIVEYQ